MFNNQQQGPIRLENITHDACQSGIYDFTITIPFSLGSILRVWWLLIINPRLLCIIYFMYTFHRSHLHLAVIQTTVEMRINTFNRSQIDLIMYRQVSGVGLQIIEHLVSCSLLIYTFRYKHSYLHLDGGLEGRVVQEFPPQWFKNRHRSGLHSMPISLR